MAALESHELKQALRTKMQAVVDTKHGQFTFFRNGEYADTENSEECGGITNEGSYRVRNGILSLHWTECNYPCSPGIASAAFELRGANTFELYDAGQAYYYYRQ